MKSRMLLSMLVIALAAALIGGATMAWFGDEAAAPEAAFQAGTVVISADGDPVISNPEKIENVNPGNCFEVCWDIVNDGSKRIELRGTLLEAWIGAELSSDNVFITLPRDSDWVLYEDVEGELWAYYLGGPIESGETVTLCLVVVFDGELTGNEYQGAAFELSAEFDAVQASNNAPSEVWGAAWDEVNQDGYEFVQEYFVTGYGATVPCLGEPDPPCDEIVDFGFTKKIDHKHPKGTTTVTGTISNAVNCDGELFTGEKQVTITLKRPGGGRSHRNHYG